MQFIFFQINPKSRSKEACQKSTYAHTFESLSQQTTKNDLEFDPLSKRCSTPFFELNRNNRCAYIRPNVYLARALWCQHLNLPELLLVSLSRCPGLTSSSGLVESRFSLQPCLLGGILVESFVVRVEAVIVRLLLQVFVDVPVQISLKRLARGTASKTLCSTDALPSLLALA